MDWFSWLSKAGLEPPLVYEYGLAFARNELQYEDIAYFNHEFLQSMGISVAKHRLEILKLAKKESGNNNPRSLSKLFVAIRKSTKIKSFGKYFSKLVFHDNDVPSNHHYHHNHDHHHLEKVRYNEHWKGALLRKQRSGDEDIGPGIKNRALALSGPLDYRVHEKVACNNSKSLKLSGPLDGKINERLMYPNKSPRLTGPGPGPGPINGRAPSVAPERLMIATTTTATAVPGRSPRFSGPLDGRAQDRFLVTTTTATTTKSPKMSGPLDGRVLSPRFCSPYEKEKVDVEYDEHSLWTALFHDMKPT